MSWANGGLNTACLVARLVMKEWPEYLGQSHGLKFSQLELILSPSQQPQNIPKSGSPIRARTGDSCSRAQPCFVSADTQLSFLATCESRTVSYAIIALSSMLLSCCLCSFVVMFVILAFIDSYTGDIQESKWLCYDCIHFRPLGCQDTSLLLLLNNVWFEPQCTNGP